MGRKGGSRSWSSYLCKNPPLRPSQAWPLITQMLPLQEGPPDHPFLPITGCPVHIVFLQNTSPFLKLSYLSIHLFVVWLFSLARKSYMSKDDYLFFSELNAQGLAHRMIQQVYFQWMKSTLHHFPWPYAKVPFSGTCCLLPSSVNTKTSKVASLPSAPLPSTPASSSAPLFALMRNKDIWQHPQHLNPPTATNNNNQQVMKWVRSGDTLAKDTLTIVNEVLGLKLWYHGQHSWSHVNSMAQRRTGFQPSQQLNMSLLHGQQPISRLHEEQRTFLNISSRR